MSSSMLWSIVVELHLLSSKKPPSMLQSPLFVHLGWKVLHRRVSGYMNQFRLMRDYSLL